MLMFRRTRTVLLHLVRCSGSAGCGWYRLWCAVFSYIHTHNIETVTIYTQKATDFDVMCHELTQHLASNTVLALEKQEQKEQF